MIPFHSSSNRAKVCRLRKLARATLDAYGLVNARFKLVRFAGNAVFRVIDPNPDSKHADLDIYKEGQYLLRIHDNREQETDAISLEMKWLKAIRKDTGLPVPEPVPALNGSMLIRLSIPGVIDERNCTLLRWVKGRYVTQNIRPCHFRAQGRIMAQLHNHASRWKPPAGLTKRRFDRAGLFEDDAGAGVPNSEAWALLPRHYLKPFEVVTRETTRIMNELGKGPDVYGLIHGDCGVDANVLFHKGEARVIDFDGSGFGYYLYDLSLALEHCWHTDDYPLFREGLLEGYREYRPLPDEQLRYLDLFLAAFYVYMGLWTVAVKKVHPDASGHPQRKQRWLERGLRYIKQHLTDF
jgi:Ser/Thr protein kinase RdoA (MazF antagonist)